MAIQTDQEFEEKFAQLGRFYRAIRKLTASVNPNSKEQVAQWIIDAGRILEVLGNNLGEIEEYTGCADLRLALDEMKRHRSEQQQKERTT